MVMMMMSIFITAAMFLAIIEERLFMCWLNFVLYSKLNQVSSHCIGILTISIIFWFDLTDFEAKCVCVQIQRSTVAFSDVQGYIASIEAFDHCPR